MSIRQQLCSVQHNRIVKLRVFYHGYSSIVCWCDPAICCRTIQWGDVRHWGLVMVKVHLCGVVEVGAATYTQTAPRLFLILLVQLVDIKVNCVYIDGACFNVWAIIDWTWWLLLLLRHLSDAHRCWRLRGCTGNACATISRMGLYLGLVCWTLLHLRMNSIGGWWLF